MDSPWDWYVIRESELPRKICRTFSSGFIVRIKPGPASREELVWAYRLAVGSQRRMRGRLRFRARQATAQFFRFDCRWRTVEVEIRTPSCPEVKFPFQQTQ